MTEEQVISDIRKDYITNLVSDGKRGDGRAFDEMRAIKLETGVIGMAEGSARVDLGKTSVLVGIKMEPGKPYPDHPDMGVMTTSSELAPIAYPAFDTGPPSPASIELSRVVDRGIRESGCIDMEKLVIEAGEKVWMVYIDIHILDHDGNLIDASGLAALAALMDTMVPASRFGLGQDFKLPIKERPVPVTMIKIGDTFLVDPDLDEERVADVRLTICTDGNGNVRAMQKGSTGGLIADEVKKAIGIAQEVGKATRGHLG
jgi:exosome complex component RRP42